MGVGRASVYNNVSTSQGQWARAEPHNMEHGNSEAMEHVARGTARPKHGWAMEYTNSSWPGGMRSNKHKR